MRRGSLESAHCYATVSENVKFYLPACPFNARIPIHKNFMSIGKSPKTTFLLFDACHIGVVLRAIILVQAAVAITVLFGSNSLLEWLQTFSLVTGATLPALLIWLTVACALKKVLQHQVSSVQWAFGLILGGACGILAHGIHTTILHDPQHKLAWLAGGVAGASMAGLLMNLLSMQQRARQPAATVARLAELQSRIRPHFLFNTLNSAIALVRQNPALAEQVLEDLSDLFHHALKNPESESTLAKEIQIARQYLAIEQVRFEQRLRVQWSIDDRALEASVPPLILQPLVENAIKHGIEPSPDGGNIHIIVRRKGQQVYIHISNTLHPRPADAVTTAGNGIALKNVRARLHLLHDVNAKFWTQRKNDRFEAAIVLPVTPLARSQPFKPEHFNIDKP